MRAPWITALFISAWLAALTAAPASAVDGPAVIACDSLLAARRVDAAASRPAEPGPDCRQVDGSGVGAVERRALVGGAPYECRAVAGTPDCLWIVP
ncbi:hypothetical protein Q8W71_25120 [Methylobacterium sp. NEAU 140]|uniref:hypothetical protein n=1 Tax=Methylobacterium sp. NEAU 140 TaxID=3064945 RepID=UPI002733C5B7|nr:hypothetical protein [Methylobacterium sp. NEAU 140]MDP4025918.1 hypothetical protein [Methylobacterium sp. NEAU 140]